MTALEAVGDLLDLRPATAGAPVPADRTALGVVAGRRGPRFLVPLGFPEAAPQSCLAYLGLRDATTRLTRGAVGLALRAGADRVVAREVLTADVAPGSLLALLDDLLASPAHERGLAVGIGLGQRDIVWKPTLQLFRPDGTPAAFVKVGLGPVAEHLVRTEAEALARWSAEADPRLVVPELLAATSWRGLPLVVVAPLPTDVRRLPPATDPSAWAVRTLGGASVEPLGTAAWWRRRRQAADANPRTASILERIEQRHDADDLAWATAHGDWVPWNLARCHRGLVAWDWEYSEPDAPVGLDEVHGAYQQAHVAAGRSIADALTAARAAARRHASPTSPAGWLADAHVAMLVTRSAELEHLAGEPPADHLELLAAADAALDASTDAVLR